MKRALIFLLSLTVLVGIGMIKCSSDGRRPTSTTSLSAGGVSSPASGGDALVQREAKLR
ncbi:MAG: hypothetical protein ACOC8N_00420 [Spirochaetota bacterium]